MKYLPCFDRSFFCLSLHLAFLVLRRLRLDCALEVVDAITQASQFLALCSMPPKDALFIVDKIIGQSAQENIPLSEVERKMLLFSESSPVLPDSLQTNEAFDRDYDRVEYETKIVRLIQHIRSGLRGHADGKRAWNEAIRNLRGKDYYFMVMLNDAGFDGRPPGDIIRLIATAIAIVSIVVAIVFLFVR